MPAFIFLLIGVFISMIITERANKKLEMEDKAKLIGLFSGQRIYNFGMLIAIFSIYFMNTQLEIIGRLPALVLYIVLLIVYIIFTNYRAQSTLRINGFPDAYIRSHLIATSIRMSSLIVYFILILL